MSTIVKFLLLELSVLKTQKIAVGYNNGGGEKEFNHLLPGSLCLACKGTKDNSPNMILILKKFQEFLILLFIQLITVSQPVSCYSQLRQTHLGY